MIGGGKAQMPQLPLLLFDIDGTLLGGGDATHGRAVRVACQELFGVAGDPREAKVDLAGRTDRYILRGLLLAYGVSEEEIEARLPEAFRFVEEYVAREIPVSTVERVLPGVNGLLEELVTRDLLLGLVTGNLADVARAKLAAAGLWAPFSRYPEVIGGFGHLSVDRNALTPVALTTASRVLGREVAGATAVVIGDTPHDVACGQVIGARTLGVATGRYSAEQLQEVGADLVLADLADHERVLQFLLA